MTLPVEEVFPNPPADIDRASLDMARIPAHVAVIMDGNGRWAEQRGRTRLKGHAAGINSVRELIRASNDIGVRYLTIYSFSTENWARPETEVKGLMTLFAKTMAAELEPLYEEGVRVRVIGDMTALPAATRRIFETACKRTLDNTGMTLVIAVNYGARQEITQAARALAAKAAAGDITPEQIAALTPEDFANYLDTSDMPDPDLLIRTSGEFRLSNFLLYQSAYSEFYISPVFWPDFDRYELLRALLALQERKRRFGGV